MPQIERSALVFYSARQMFELVNDVPRYPEFLPGCAKAQILQQSADQMLAKLQVKKAGISQEFTTRNTLVTNSQIQMQLESGPFKALSGGWTFVPLSDEACKMVLSLDFEFSNKIVEFAFGKIFNELTAAMVGAFTQRAKQVYGEQHGGN